jgi:hypothetical protein
MPQLDIATLHTLFYILTLTVVVGTLLLIVSPYRIQQGQHALSSILPADVRQEFATLNEAWGGKIKVTPTQQWLLSFLAVAASLVVGSLLAVIVDPLWGAILGLVVAVLAGIYPHQKFKGGFPQPLLYSLEREAPLLASFAYRTRGVAGLSVQVALQQFMEVYPDTQTARLLRQVPEGNAYAEELLRLGFPADEVPNWLNVIGTLVTVGELGNPKAVLARLRDQTRAKEVEFLRKLIKGKAFKAPALTVLIILPGLLAIMLGSIMLQAMQGLGGVSF